MSSGAPLTSTALAHVALWRCWLMSTGMNSVLRMVPPSGRVAGGTSWWWWVSGAVVLGLAGSAAAPDAYRQQTSPLGRLAGPAKVGFLDVIEDHLAAVQAASVVAYCTGAVRGRHLCLPRGPSCRTSAQRAAQNRRLALGCDGDARPVHVSDALRPRHASRAAGRHSSRRCCSRVLAGIPRPSAPGRIRLPDSYLLRRLHRHHNVFRAASVAGPGSPCR